MSFLFATLNPVKKNRHRRRRKFRSNSFLTASLAKSAFRPNARHRRRRGGKRRLTAWQRAVRKFGGVMQAVRALKHGKKRRSAVSRRSLRSRSRRRIHRRRPSMARVRRRRHRRHRMPPRGRGGRFMSRHHRRRRHRRNPVVPVSFNPGRRRRRRRRNPLYLSRRGFSGRKHRGYRQMHRRRRRPHFWHNAVVPMSWNPRRRRHRRHRRNMATMFTYNRGRRRHYRRNPVTKFFAFNPGGSSDVLGSVMTHVKSLVDVQFWTETGVPAAVGFFGSKTLGGMLHQYTLTQFAGVAPTSPYYPYTKALCDTLSGAGLAWAAGRFYSKKAGDAIWLGTVVNVAYSLLKSLFGSTSFGQMIGLSGMGDDLSDRLKDAVTQRVRQSLSGYLNTTDLRQRTGRAMGTYVNTTGLREGGYDPSPRADLRDYDVASTETSL